MNVRLAVLCDAANVSQEGKLNILGDFDVIWARVLPARWPAMCYVSKLAIGAADMEEGGTFRLEFLLECRSPDGQTVASVTGSIAGEAPTDGRLLKIPLILNIQGAEFRALGTYEFVLMAKGKELAVTELDIRPPPGP